MSKSIYVVCVSGTHERLQMAAMIASVAAATGDEVSVFFSMNSLKYFVKNDRGEPPAEGEFGEAMAKENIPPFRQLFSQSVELGDVKLLPCSMAMDILKVTEDDLEEYMGPPTGLTRFLDDAADGQVITF